MRPCTGAIRAGCAAIILARRIPFERIPWLNVDEAIRVVAGEWMRTGAVPPGTYALDGLAVGEGQD
jgi:hypothetical protein